MDAPIYAPARAFEQPRPGSFRFGVSSVSIAEMMTSPAAWGIVLKHLPMFKAMIGSPQLQPLLTNMTVDSFVTYLPSVITQAKIDAIDAELAILPQRAWPAL